METATDDLELTLGKAADAARARPSRVTSNEAVRPPRLIPRRLFTDAVIQLFHAERATERVCRLMTGQTGTPIADQLLEYQANDEHHHADLYESYLLRISDIRPQDTQIADSLDMLLDTSLGQEAVFAGYNVVLEGEAVKLQQDTIERFTCPALVRITRAISWDEARHVSFGHAYLADRLPKLEHDHRFEIYRYIKQCWEVAAAAPRDDTGAFGKILIRKRAEYMNARWHQHHRALTKIGLILPGELPPT